MQQEPTVHEHRVQEKLQLVRGAGQKCLVFQKTGNEHQNRLIWLVLTIRSSIKRHFSKPIKHFLLCLVFESLCKDDFAHCPVFALRGDCKTNPHHMLDKCKRSCNLCGDLVQQKDRIQPTSKKAVLRRPSTLANQLPYSQQYDDWNPKPSDSYLPYFEDSTTTVSTSTSFNNWRSSNRLSTTRFTTTTTLGSFDFPRN